MDSLQSTDGVSEYDTPDQEAHTDELLDEILDVFDQNDPMDVAIFLARGEDRTYRSIAKQVADRRAESPGTLSSLEKECESRANYMFRQLKKQLTDLFDLDFSFEQFEALITEQQGLELI